jgi:MerR family Zn(II)-responsive transcriptional regulator of zntA
MGGMPQRPAGHLRSTQLARLAGVSPDTLRHYELKGLLPKATRSANGYREYPPEAGVRVRLVRRAVSLGFTLDELARIVKVRDQGGAPCREVRALAAEKLALLEERIDELKDACDRLRGVLDHWDALLTRTPSGGRAALLDALEGLVEPGRPSPLVPHALHRRRV